VLGGKTVVKRNEPSKAGRTGDQRLSLVVRPLVTASGTLTDVRLQFGAERQSLAGPQADPSAVTGEGLAKVATFSAGRCVIETVNGVDSASGYS
jgi:hypothetical protein